MLTLIFIAGFVLLAIFIPQAISGLDWQTLIEILRTTDDEWLKEIVTMLNLEYTTPTQFATQSILICVGILIAYIVLAIILTKYIKKLSNNIEKQKNNQETNIIYNKPIIEQKEMTLKEKLKYKKYKLYFTISLIPLLLFIIFIVLLSIFKENYFAIPAMIFFIIGILAICFILDQQPNENDTQQETKIRNIEEIQTDKTSNNETIVENNIIKKPNISPEIIKKLQNKKNQNTGENTNE